MRGLALHGNLVGANSCARRGQQTGTALLGGDEHPATIPAPAGDGAAVAGEVYDISVSHLQRVLEHEPAGLGLGVVEFLGMGEKCLGILWTASRLPRRAMDIRPSAAGGNIRNRSPPKFRAPRASGYSHAGCWRATRSQSPGSPLGQPLRTGPWPADAQRDRGCARTPPRRRKRRRPLTGGTRPLPRSGQAARPAGPRLTEGVTGNRFRKCQPVQDARNPGGYSCVQRQVRIAVGSGHAQLESSGTAAARDPYDDGAIIVAPADVARRHSGRC